MANSLACGLIFRLGLLLSLIAGKKFAFVFKDFVMHAADWGGGKRANEGYSLLLIGFC